MSPGEVLYRVRKKISAIVQQRGLFVAASPPAPIFSDHDSTWLKVAPDIDAEVYCRSADSLMLGRFAIFALEDADIGVVPEWNRDPRSGVVAPLIFGKTLDYRDSAVVGDIKYLWEPNRHLQLVRIAQAYVLSGDEKYLAHLSKLLNSWFDQCPYLLGPNWTSSLELGIRLINWSITWQLVGGEDSPLFSGEAGQALKKRWLTSIYQHCDFIHGHYSRFSSANNHLIGEAAGLFVATISWPYWRRSQQWNDGARAVLEAEAVKQTAEDGVNREQAVSYQQFVLDFLIIAGLAVRRSETDFSPAYWQRIEAMMAYLYAIMDVAGNVPMIGDADDGYVVSLDAAQDFCPYRSLLASGAILFSRPEYLRKAGGLDDKTRWLFGNAGLAAADAPHSDMHTVRQAFPEGGYYVLGGDFDTPEEVRCVFDCGPLGYLSIAAHGHADALSLTLSSGGREFLIDPGTYAYHTQQKWRDYFRGTGAHNTVRIDGVDQSQSGGNFMWLAKATAVCERFEFDDEDQVIIGEHDGYRRLPDAVTHSRKLVYNNASSTMQVIDYIECKSEHRLERMWHFAEGCEVSRDGQQLNVENSGKRIVINLATSGEGSITIYQGSDSPTSGWISRRFDRKQPITTVVESYTITGSTELTAVIACRPSV